MQRNTGVEDQAKRVVDNMFEDRKPFVCPGVNVYLTQGN